MGIFQQAAYLVATALFIFSLYWMNDPKTARGPWRRTGGMLLAILATWFSRRNCVPRLDCSGAGGWHCCRLSAFAGVTHRRAATDSGLATHLAAWLQGWSAWPNIFWHCITVCGRRRSPWWRSSRKLFSASSP